MIILRLALASLRSRWLTAALTAAAIALSVLLMIGVEKIRIGARASFSDTISGTDLIVGARAGSIQLLLYSVFRIGDATNNITWQSYQKIAGHPAVDWAVPLSLGDSHRGFRVLGTTRNYFENFKFRRKQSLDFKSGQPFDDLFDAVIGADVAASLSYGLGDRIIVAHGAGALSLSKHDDKPFQVSGILAKTGTPVDRTVHVSLEAIEAIHLDWQGGAAVPGKQLTADQVRQLSLEPSAVTAALLGLKSRLAVFGLQREINTFAAEPLSAILPGVALQELWELVGTAEAALTVVTVLVVLTAFFGMMTMLFTTLNERRREMAILRSVGARPRTIFGMLVIEAGVLTLVGALVGVGLLYVSLAVVRPIIDANFGLYIAIDPPTGRELLMIGGVIAAGFAIGVLPAIRAYRMSLVDGMTVQN